MTPSNYSLSYQSQTLDHLGLVAALIDELGIVEILDGRIPQDRSQVQVSAGQAVKAMILNGLGFAQHALYLTPHFFQDKPVERLIGPGIQAEHLNDDRLGRVLDDLHSHDIETLYFEIAHACVQKLGLSGHFVHLDSTSFHTDGKASSSTDEAVIQVTRGYSRDHRPDLNQVVLQLMCEQQAGLPILMQSLSGNSSDSEGFRVMVQRFIGELKGSFGMNILVADAAWYSAQTLTELSPALKWISRVPEKLHLAGELLEQIAPDLTTHSTDTAFRSVGTVYAGVKQRWVVGFSPEADARSRVTLARSWLKTSQAEVKAFSRLGRQAFACEADAREAGERFQKSLQLTTLEEFSIRSVPRYARKGRPTPGQEPERYEFFIEGSLASSLAVTARQRQRAGCFILSSNELDSGVLSDEALIAAYKKQQTVERGFRFLKDPLFMASTLFLKSPQRIMALMMIMTLSLLVYSALEYRIREQLKTAQATYPDQKGKPSKTPTARWIFQSFRGIHLLKVNLMQECVLNLQPHQQQLLTLLGPRYTALYSGKG